MASRYGRNQKRAHRAKIAELETTLHITRLELVRAQGERTKLQNQLYAAKEIALTEFIAKQDYIKYVAECMGEALGGIIGETLKPHAQRLMEADMHCRRYMPSIRAYSSPGVSGKRDVVLRGEVPAIDYNIVFQEL